MRTSLLLLLLAAGGADAVENPGGPGVSLAEGKSLLELARKAMESYLTERLGPDQIPTPPGLNRLAGQGYGVVCTLRSGGKKVASEMRTGQDTCRNLVYAALVAMRSPALPDRVTKEVLDSLTVEVEVIGPARRVEGDLGNVLVPGLTGLSLAQGTRVSRVLPSTAYLLAPDADTMRRRCMMQLPDALPAERKWFVFDTRHYVGYPDGMAFWLYRGKILLPARSLDERMLSAAAGAVGAYLARGQDESGLYAVGEGRISLTEQLHATWVMARLTKATGNRVFAAGVNAALSLAAGLVRRKEGLAHVAGETRQEELQATALLALALLDAPPSEPGDELRGQLAARLRRALGTEDPTDRTAMDDRLTAAMVLTALCRVIDNLDDEALRDGLERIVPADGAVPKAEGKPSSGIVETAWTARALASGGFGAKQAHAKTSDELCGWLIQHQRGDSAPRDEIGGLSERGAPPGTFSSGLAAAVLAEVAAARPNAEVHTAMQRMQVFCYQMMFKPHEAYFAADPNAWIGAVRAAPVSAKVTLPACVGALEAFLAR